MGAQVGGGGRGRYSVHFFVEVSYRVTETLIYPIADHIHPHFATLF